MSTNNSTNDAFGLGSGTLGLTGSNASPNNAQPDPHNNATATHNAEETEQAQFYRYLAGNLVCPTSVVTALMEKEGAPREMRAGVLFGKPKFFGIEDLEAGAAVATKLLNEMKAEQLAALQDRLDLVETEKAELKGELDKTKVENEETKAELDKTKVENEETKAALGDLTTKKEELEKELAATKNDWEETAAAMKELKVKYDKQKAELDVAKKRSDNDKATIADLENRVKCTQQELKIAENNVSQATEGIQAARQTLEVERMEHTAALKRAREGAGDEIESFLKKFRKEENNEDNKDD